MVKAIVLAAGRGRRLESKTPKVLHKVFDKPILAWVLDSLAEVEVDEIIVVCGYQANQVQDFLHAYPVNTVIQEEQMGTGHALMTAASKLQAYEGTIIILNGDSPLIQAETINSLLKYHRDNVMDLSILSCKLDRPDGYGRIIRKDGNIMGIKEHKDCSEAERTIKEVNAGVYCMEWEQVKSGLQTLRNNNAQEEYYLTDLVAWSYTQGNAIGSHDLQNPYEVMGVNTREDLALVWKLTNEANLQKLMDSGVTIVDPSNTMISPDADIGKDSVIFPNTYIQRRVVIGESCNIGPNTSILGPAEIGSNTNIIQSHITRSSIGSKCEIGPFANIRAGSDIANEVRVGCFVEVKNSVIGDKSAAAHLSYIGDTKIKNNVNIGAGTVVANYDHRTGDKYECVINSNSSTGANSVLISPVEIGENSTIGAGSVITENVPKDSLAIARLKQENKASKSKV